MQVNTSINLTAWLIWQVLCQIRREWCCTALILSITIQVLTCFKHKAQFFDVIQVKPKDSSVSVTTIAGVLASQSHPQNVQLTYSIQGVLNSAVVRVPDSRKRGQRFKSPVGT